jgi:hypothetical protein
MRLVFNARDFAALLQRTNHAQEIKDSSAPGNIAR